MTNIKCNETFKCTITPQIYWSLNGTVMRKYNYAAETTVSAFDVMYYVKWVNVNISVSGVIATQIKNFDRCNFEIILKLIVI